MNFKQIEAFRAVMATGSMTTAAGLLHTSQPNISRWISLLETQVGFSLFQRVGTKLLATPEAEAFHAEVERAFIGLDSLAESADSIRRRGTGVLRIGAVGSITECVLPDALLLFREQHPDIPVVIHTGSQSAAVAKWVATGYCDIGLCSLRTELPGLRYQRLYTAYGVAIVSASHRLAERSRLYPADFAQEAFISLPSGSINRAAIDHHFPDNARIINIETPYATTICLMVAKGLGISIVSSVVARALHIPQLREIPFSEKVPFHSYAVTSDHFPASYLSRRLLACIEQVYARRAVAGPALPAD